MRQLEVGDLFSAYLGGTIWLVEVIGGRVRGCCVKEGVSRLYAIGDRQYLGESIDENTVLVATNVADFEHACAIVALLS